MTDSAPPPPFPSPTPSPSAPAPGRDTARWQIGPAGGIELDELTLELRRGGQPVAIEPKPLELLMLLVRQPGAVVTKDELLDHVWAGRVVSESVLTKCVAKLREALGDSDQTLIKTVHGFGYRLMAPVLRLGAVRASAAPATAWLQPGAAVPLRANWRLVSRYEGARGENWLAEQVKTGEKRVFKFARDGAALTALKREITLHRLLREALGPRSDIVRVLDWNLDELPYFVELDHCSEGSVAEWAQRAGGIGAVPLATRLDIVARTAEALAAAHSVGVLHKDIKPGNVLIELDAAGSPRVRLGDFGSAQVLDDERLRALDITRMGLTQTLRADETTSGTWAYLAPEVIAGQPPTVQSDLYALGAMLYQMVVGDLRRPLAPGWERDLDDPLLREDVAVCCDQEPARRLGDAAELGRRLRTLEVRREARLAQERAAADAMAAREALRQGRTRRVWLLAVTGISLAAALVTGMQYFQVERARDEAQRQAAAARSVNEFLVQDLIGAANPVGNFGVATLALPNSGQVPVRELLDRASVRAGERFAGQPALESAVRSSLGGALDGLSAYKEAAREYEASARLAATSATRDRSAEAQTLLQAGIARINTDEVDQAEARLAEAQGLLDGIGASAGLALRIQALRAYLRFRRGDARASIEQLRALTPGLGAAFGERSAELADHFKLLAEVEREAGQLADSQRTAQQAHDLTVSIYGNKHPRALFSGIDLAVATGMVGRWAEAEPMMRRQLALGTELLGADHYFTLRSQAELASALENLKRYDEAVPLLEDAVKRRLQVFGDKNSESAMFMNNLGVLYSKVGRLDDSFEWLSRMYRVTSTLDGPDHPASLIARHQVARIQQLRGRWAEARKLQEDLLPAARKALGAAHWRVGVMQSAWARTQKHFGERRDARTNVEEALSLLVPALGENHDQVQQARSLLHELSGPSAR